MIFVTVGTQLPFDRMVGTVDAWAARSGQDVFAQVGPTRAAFAHLRVRDFLEPAAFDRCFQDASLVVAHAGMGSILDALSFGKPIIIMPRKGTLGEHRNDHQMGTARHFQGKPGLMVAWDEDELTALLDRFGVSRGMQGPSRIEATAPESFLTKLRGLIDQPTFRS